MMNFQFRVCAIENSMNDINRFYRKAYHSQEGDIEKMALKTKKIKFALKMKDDVEVRTLKELKEAFDLNQAVSYFLDGKLETWLSDRYYDHLAEQIQSLNKNDPELRRKLCEIFEVEYEDDSLSVEEIEERNHRIQKLKEVTDDEDLIKNIDSIAFCQEDLADLLDEGKETIYLCGTDFHIPFSKKGITYIGIKTRLDITQEEKEKYQSNTIELIDLLDDEVLGRDKLEPVKIIPQVKTSTKREPESVIVEMLMASFFGKKY